MPVFERGEVRIHYEERGEGFPLLLLAPGGMRSTIAALDRLPVNPLEALSDRYRVIAMDQRNAGDSWAPVSGRDGWHSYTADQLALLDHLGVERCHLLGVCIGGSFIMGLVEAAPERVVSAVLVQPIGLEANRHVFHELFDGWADEIRARHPEADEADWAAFRENMYGGDFQFNVGPRFVSRLTQPLLVLRGDDIYHPGAISEAIADLAPRGRLIREWKTPETLSAAWAEVEAFLERYTPHGA